MTVRVSLAHARRVFDESPSGAEAERRLGVGRNWMYANGFRKPKVERRHRVRRSFRLDILHAHGWTLDMIEAATGVPPAVAVAAIRANVVQAGGSA